MGDRKNLILPIAFVISAASIGYVLAGLIPAVVFTIAFGGGLLLYVATAWRRQFDTRKVVIPYLLTVMLFLIHTYEEYLTDFEGLLSTMAGRTVAEADFLLLVAWIAPFVWVGGAVLLVRQSAFGYYFLCAFLVAMTIAELAHYVFPFVIDG